MAMAATPELGGLGSTIGDIARELEAVAAACGSTAWCLWNHLCVFHLYVGTLGPPNAELLASIVAAPRVGVLPGRRRLAGLRAPRRGDRRAGARRGRRRSAPAAATPSGPPSSPRWSTRTTGEAGLATRPALHHRAPRRAERAHRARRGTAWRCGRRPPTPSTTPGRGCRRHAARPGTPPTGPTCCGASTTTSSTRATARTGSASRTCGSPPRPPAPPAPRTTPPRRERVHHVDGLGRSGAPVIRRAAPTDEAGPIVRLGRAWQLLRRGRSTAASAPSWSVGPASPATRPGAARRPRPPRRPRRAAHVGPRRRGARRPVDHHPGDAPHGSGGTRHPASRRRRRSRRHRPPHRRGPPRPRRSSPSRRAELIEAAIGRLHAGGAGATRRPPRALPRARSPPAPNGSGPQPTAAG